MGYIRPFAESDIPQVARLHWSVFRPGGLADSTGFESYRAYFGRVFLDTASRDGLLSSLVYYEDSGRIIGFLGVVPRRVTLNGRRFQAAISSQFIVDPSCHVGLTAVRLAKAFLNGPQDLSIADDANDVTRTMWEGLGGTTALLHSIYWTRPLRPAQLALTFARKHRRLAPLAAAARPLAWAVDALATSLPRGQFRQSRPGTSSGTLGPAECLRYLPEFAGAGSLRVDYDDRTLRWLASRAEQRKRDGKLRRVAVTEGQRVIGWYVYHLNDEKIADVLQLAAAPPSIRPVLDHLFHEAWREGAVGVTGRMEPRFLQALSDSYCVFHRRGPWMLVHTTRPELLQSFLNGTACFSRIDGEWSLGFTA
jgi:hypothetical protein